MIQQEKPRKDMFSVEILPHQAPLPLHSDFLRIPSLGARELDVFLNSSLPHSVPSASLSCLICELKTIMATSQNFSEDLMNVEALFNKCYANIKYYFSSYGRINPQHFIGRLFCSYASFPSSLRRPSLSLSKEPSSLEATCCRLCLYRCESPQRSRSESASICRRKYKSPGNAVPKSINSRGAISQQLVPELKAERRSQISSDLVFAIIFLSDEWHFLFLFSSECFDQ